MKIFSACGNWEMVVWVFMDSLACEGILRKIRVPSGRFANDIVFYAKWNLDRMPEDLGRNSDRYYSKTRWNSAWILAEIPFKSRFKFYWNLWKFCSNSGQHSAWIQGNILINSKTVIWTNPRWDCERIPDGILSESQAGFWAYSRHDSERISERILSEFQTGVWANLWWDS